MEKDDVKVDLGGILDLGWSSRRNSGNEAWQLGQLGR
jgi:hypothetical protein